MSRGGPRLHTAAVHPFDEVNGNEPFVSTRPDNEIDLQTATFRFSILDPHMSEATTCMTPGAVYRLYGCCINLYGSQGHIASMLHSKLLLFQLLYLKPSTFNLSFLSQRLSANYANRDKQRALYLADDEFKKTTR